MRLKILKFRSHNLLRFLPRKLSYAFILFTLEERNNKLVRTINGMEISPKFKKRTTTWFSKDLIPVLTPDLIFLTTALDLAQGVKKRPAMQEMQVLSLGQEDPIEEEMATHSSILALLEVYSTPQRNCLEANINNYTFMH